MATQTTAAPATAPNLSSSVIRVLALPWLDRTIAAIACVPLVYGAYYRYEHFHHGFPLIAAALNTLILVATMVIRRPPKRVTPNPLYWLLAFVASYWLILILGLLQRGRPLAANWITDAIAVFDEFGFREHLTPQRSNGLRSMVERIRSDAREALAAAS